MNVHGLDESAFPPQPPLLGCLWRRGSPIPRRFRRLGRVFVTLAAISLEYVGNLTEEALLFLALFLVLDSTGCLGVPICCGGWQRSLRTPSKDAREEPLRSACLVAGVVRFGAGHEGDRVVIRTGGSCEPVGDLVQLNVDHAFRLAERLDIGILGKRHSLLHELGPDGGRSLRAAQPEIAVVVISHPYNA